MKTHLESANGSIHTAVIDLLLLLVIAFLTVGVLAHSLALEDINLERLKQKAADADQMAVKERKSIEDLRREHERLQQEHKRLVAQGVDKEKLQEEIQKVRQALSNAKQKLNKLLEAIASLMGKVTQLKQQVEASAKREQEWRGLESDQSRHTDDLLRLENEKTEYTRRLAEIQASLASAGKDKYSVKSGAPMVRRDKVPRVEYLVMLAEGKATPVAPPYYTGVRRPDGSLVLWPVQSGLTIQEVLKPNSPVMKEVMTTEFRKHGQVNILVNSDSFATFRALRDELVRQGVDYGWEPVEGTRLTSSKEGRNIPPQGGE